MPTEYTTDGYVQLDNVRIVERFSSTPASLGDFGSRLEWSGFLGVVDQDVTLTDVNGDGFHEVNEDYWSDPSIKYSGYTVSFGGSGYGIFTDGTSFYIPIGAASNQVFAAEQQDGTSFVFNPGRVGLLFCFAEGTQIDTAIGTAAVESLRTGDMVRTASGGSTGVLWVGKQTVFRAFADAARQVLVEIKAGALGGGLPRRDLRVTADHALLLDGLLVNAGVLVGAPGIDYVPGAALPDTYAIYHVETAAHDVILAEGAPAETFIDYAGRQRFDNYAEYATLHAADRFIPESPLPRISSARLLPPSLKRRLGFVKAA